MRPTNPNPFEDPAFLEALEAAGYLQRLDTSEARITARFQHALTKMAFAAHSEAFLRKAGVHKVHASTVQFFCETPVSDPFVHVLVGSLPPSQQALITPDGLPTSGWTPIASPDEAEGTIHFTVSHAGFWPLTVVFDSNPTRSLVMEEDEEIVQLFSDDSGSESDDLERPARPPRPRPVEAQDGGDLTSRFRGSGRAVLRDRENSDQEEDDVNRPLTTTEAERLGEDL